MIDVTRRHPASYCVEEARGVEVEPKDFKDSGLKRNSVVFIGVIMGSMMLLVLLVLGFVVLSRKLYTRGVSEQKLLHKSVQDYYVTGYPSQCKMKTKWHWNSQDRKAFAKTWW
ncbi:hypothetical protein L1887_29926 [Cichorium endivia]|nr:hypothetical protein L1887_29926 [Cichorium endivia]